MSHIAQLPDSDGEPYGNRLRLVRIESANRRRRRLEAEGIPPDEQDERPLHKKRGQVDDDDVS